MCALLACRKQKAAAAPTTEEADANEEEAWRVEAAAAAVLVETAVAAAVINECRICGRSRDVELMRWDAKLFANVCDGDSDCVPPGKRARREGSYAQMHAGRARAPRRGT